MPRQHEWSTFLVMAVSFKNSKNKFKFFTIAFPTTFYGSSSLNNFNVTKTAKDGQDNWLDRWLFFNRKPTLIYQIFFLNCCWLFIFPYHVVKNIYFYLSLPNWKLFQFCTISNHSVGPWFCLSCSFPRDIYGSFLLLKTLQQRTDPFNYIKLLTFIFQTIDNLFQKQLKSWYPTLGQSHNFKLKSFCSPTYFSKL